MLEARHGRLGSGFGAAGPSVRGNRMAKLDELMTGARDTATVGRVYGEPYEKDGVTLIPAASVKGCGCGGEGEQGGPFPGGGGFGMSARPVGAFQIKDDEVTWIPVADRTRVIVLSQAVAIVALLVLRSILRARRSGA